MRYNHYNGDGWEHRPWPAIDGVRCDPVGGIAAVARREDLADVFIVDTDNTLRRRQRHHRSWTPVWDAIPGGGLDATSSLAASRLDENTIMWCGVRPTDNQVSRTLINQDGVAENWRPAPVFRARRVAATPAEDARGHIYATAVHHPERTIWDTPDVVSLNPNAWDSVGALLFEPVRPSRHALSSVHTISSWPVPGP